jgi:hypothetical protein
VWRINVVKIIIASSIHTFRAKGSPYCAIFVQPGTSQQTPTWVTVMLSVFPGRVCFRRLSRLPACRHISAKIVLRIPPSFGNRAYYNSSSFSARPNNSLTAKIWYRKNGVPRSKWKGVLFCDYNFLIIWTLLTIFGSISCFVCLHYT